MNDPIIINNFQSGIAESPHVGFGLMRNVEIEDFPGAVRPGKSVISLFATATSSTFTANAGDDVCTGATFTNDANTTGVAVVLTTTGALPAGLSAGTIYFVIQVNQAAGTFKLATTLTNAGASTAIDITGAGTGTHTVTTINPATINHIVRHEKDSFDFMLDSNGRVWFNDSQGGAGTTMMKLLVNSAIDSGAAGTLTNANGNGMVLWKQNDSGTTFHLIVFRNAVIDIVDVYATTDRGAPSWTNGWNFGGSTSDTALNTGASTNNSHHAKVGQDDIVYFCDGRFVGTIKEVTGATFAPGTATTYVGNDQALDLPSDEIAQWLEEQRDVLLIGGNNKNKIYPWNRISDSFNIPIEVPARSIKKLKNVGGLVYILAGTKGDIFVTQGSYVTKFISLPEQLINNSESVVENTVTWGALEHLDGHLLVGVGGQTTANNGVYKINLETKVITIDHIPSTGGANVTAISAFSQLYNYGYANGADRVRTSRYASFEGIIQSQLYRVATKTEKGHYSVLEAVIAKPTSSGNVRVSYRNDTSSSFTTLDTFAADGSNTTFKNDAIGLIDQENIQVQAEIDGSVELLEIRILP